MAKTFKVFSALLSYPDEALKAAAPELREAITREALLPPHAQKPVLKLIAEIEARDLYDLQERYVLLFDRTRSLSLHLFEHIHGESRDRGGAMIDLMALYEEHELAIDAKELPDYLPMFLEFLSILPADEACDMLSQPLHIISALGERLRKRKSVYAGLFRALEALAKVTPDAAALEALLQEPEDDPNDLAALDKIWEEEVVTFGPGAGLGDGAAAADGCSKVSDMLRRMGADQVPDPLRPGQSTDRAN